MADPIPDADSLCRGGPEGNEPRQLTARGVKAMLSRSGVDQADLTIVEDPAVWTDLKQGTSTPLW